MNKTFKVEMKKGKCTSKLGFRRGHGDGKKV
jgi:hypothetical protein